MKFEEDAMKFKEQSIKATLDKLLNNKSMDPEPKKRQTFRDENYHDENFIEKLIEKKIRQREEARQ